MVMHALLLPFPRLPSSDGNRVGTGHRSVRIGTPQPERLLALLNKHGFAVERLDDHQLVVEHRSAEEVASLVRFFNVPVHHIVASPA